MWKDGSPPPTHTHTGTRARTTHRARQRVHSSLPLPQLGIGEGRGRGGGAELATLRFDRLQGVRRWRESTQSGENTAPVRNYAQCAHSPPTLHARPSHSARTTQGRPQTDTPTHTALVADGNTQQGMHSAVPSPSSSAEGAEEGMAAPEDARHIFCTVDAHSSVLCRSAIWDVSFSRVLSQAVILDSANGRTYTNAQRHWNEGNCYTNTLTHTHTKTSAQRGAQPP